MRVFLESDSLEAQQVAGTSANEEPPSFKEQPLTSCPLIKQASAATAAATAAGARPPRDAMRKFDRSDPFMVSLIPHRCLAIKQAGSRPSHPPSDHNKPLFRSTGQDDAPNVLDTAMSPKRLRP
jgi:hypothetical protein